MSNSTIPQVCPKASAEADDLLTPEEFEAEVSQLLAERTKANETMTPAQGKYLAWLVCSLYPEWDEDRVMAAIGHAVASHPDKGAATITVAVLAWAADGTNLTPGGVSVPGGHWVRAQTFAESAATPPTA
ncbi:hypothetical protein [Arthrobacter sp. G119Y2]|uniref:hypothetical protein n=1 Tax=Arthrobacter sp. G119Y2 TaxID=3134965 RepID=UPI00311A8ABD